MVVRNIYIQTAQAVWEHRDCLDIDLQYVYNYYRGREEDIVYTAMLLDLSYNKPQYVTSQEELYEEQCK
jgi:hypothetical protein